MPSPIGGAVAYPNAQVNLGIIGTIIIILRIQKQLTHSLVPGADILRYFEIWADMPQIWTGQHGLLFPTPRPQKWSPTHKNQRDHACGPYHRYLPTCSSNNSVLTIDHGQNVVKQESLSRHEEVANNNASNHGFYCLRQDYGQVSQHKPYRRMFHCSKRSLQPYLSFSTSLLFSVTANPSRTKHK